MYNFSIIHIKVTFIMCIISFLCSFGAMKAIVVHFPAFKTQPKNISALILYFISAPVIFYLKLNMGLGDSQASLEFNTFFFTLKLTWELHRALL